jgi:uncharacterized protein (TIGR02271 family)
VINNDQIEALNDAEVRSMDDDKIGSVNQVYLEDSTNEPAWVTMKTGFFGGNVSFVPLANASWDGEVLRVPYEKSFVKDSPNLDPDAHLGPDEEATLYGYYGIEYGTGGAGYAGNVGAAGRGAETYADSSADPSADVYADTYPDTSAGTTTGGDSMTRSEEQLSVGTEQRESGRVRLRKYVVTEQQTVEVPVSHEEVRVEREPITDANVGDAYEGPDITESEHEVVLHEERPVVTTEAHPVERVRLSTESVTGSEAVTGEVRKEQIELEGDGELEGDRA